MSQEPSRGRCVSEPTQRGPLGAVLWEDYVIRTDLPIA